MAISFDGVPNALRTPFVAIEFDASNSAGSRTTVQAYKGLLMGQKLSSGSAVAGVPVRISSEEQAASSFGAGSMLHAMAKAWFANNTFTEVYAVALADDSAGIASTGTLTVTGPATTTGTVYLYVGGHKLKIAVASGATAAQIADAIADAVNDSALVPVTATVLGGVVTLTAKHKGAFGNELDVRLNYNAGEALPGGVQIAVVALSGGANNPEIDPVFAAIGDEHFNVFAMPYTDAENLATLKTKMDERFGPMKQLDGVAFAAKSGTLGSLQVLGGSLNTQHLSVMGCRKVPTATYEVAAAIAGLVAFYAPIDPARPFQTLPIKGLMAPALQDRFTQAERNSLLFDGISTFVIGSDGEAKVERLITTYQLSPAGAETDAYLDVETLFTLSYLRYDLRNFVLAKYPRHKLASDGTRFGAGQQIVTPRLLKAELLTRFRAWEEMGLVENFDQFKKDLIVERNAQDPNRLDVLLPPDLINQLRVTSVKVQFRV